MAVAIPLDRKVIKMILKKKKKITCESLNIETQMWIIPLVTGDQINCH